MEKATREPLKNHRDAAERRRQHPEHSQDRCINEPREPVHNLQTLLNCEILANQLTNCVGNSYRLLTVSYSNRINIIAFSRKENNLKLLYQKNTTIKSNQTQSKQKQKI